jgi:hypothetical protein
MFFYPLLYNTRVVKIDIVLSIDGVCKLANVVIFNPTQVDLVSHVVIYCGVIVIVATQVKNEFYHNQFMTNMLLPLVVEVF